MKPETAETAYWRNPLQEKPMGKCQLLTVYGTTVIGYYRGEPEYVACAPLIRIPDWARRRMEDYNNGLFD